MSLLDEARNAPVWGERVKDMKTHVPISPEARDALVELAEQAERACYVMEREYPPFTVVMDLRAALERLQR